MLQANLAQPPVRVWSSPLDLVIAVNCTSQPFGFVVALARGGDDYELEPMLASEVAVQAVPTLADLDFDGDLDVIWGQYHAEDSPSPIVQLNMLR